MLLFGETPFCHIRFAQPLDLGTFELRASTIFLVFGYKDEVLIPCNPCFVKYLHKKGLKINHIGRATESLPLRDEHTVLEGAAKLQRPRWLFFKIFRIGTGTVFGRFVLGVDVCHQLVSGNGFLRQQVLGDLIQ